MHVLPMTALGPLSPAHDNFPFTAVQQSILLNTERDIHFHSGITQYWLQRKRMGAVEMLKMTRMTENTASWIVVLRLT